MKGAYESRLASNSSNTKNYSNDAQNGKPPFRHCDYWPI